VNVIKKTPSGSAICRFIGIANLLLMLWIEKTASAAACPGFSGETWAEKFTGGAAEIPAGKKEKFSYFVYPFYGIF
jgi:hypothetical protein